MHSVPRKKTILDPTNSEQIGGESYDGPNESSSSSSSKGSSTNNSDSSNSVHNIDQVLENAIDVKDLFSPPEQDSPLHILVALCDDLLYDIFERLRGHDLLNVAKVCVRFQSQAQAVFASKYKHLKLNCTVKCGQNKIESILCEFGPFIQSLSIDSSKNATDGSLFRAIIQNCTSKLKVLRLINVNIQVDAPNFRLPFPKLEEFELNSCEGNYSLANLIDDCPELEEIDLCRGQMQGVNELISRKFKKLKRLYLSFDNTSDAALEYFITSNPGLIDLTVNTHYGLQTSHALRLIGQKMLGLKKLNFFPGICNLDQFQSDVQHIGNLSSLKSLWLEFNEMEVAPLASVLVTNNLPIEEFGMENASIDDNAITWICQLKQINTLKFQWSGLDEENLVTLAKNLPELQELHWDGRNWLHDFDNIIQMIHHAKKLSYFYFSVYKKTEYEIDLDDYNEMLVAIQSRPEKIGLRIKLGSGIFVVVPKNILQENREILSIIERWD